MDSGEGIRVGIRLRPLNNRELTNGERKIFQCQPSCNSVSQVANNNVVKGQTFHYDKVFDETCSTTDVYNYSAHSVIEGVLNGINGTIFAYGQTSSGKTFTMIGTNDSPGVIDLSALEIFRFIDNHPERSFTLKASFVEIYNENIRDLLSDSISTNIPIRENPDFGVYCEASEKAIYDLDSIRSLLERGIAKRTVECTAMNDVSSRSHTIFKLLVESTNKNELDSPKLRATLNLVDLAGTESVRHTNAVGNRAKEGGKINQSLLSLSRVIHSLSIPGTFVNFRDSKLTRLLQPSLSGNAKMSIVCCITVAERYLEETRSTLQFASRAKMVKTNAKVNEIVDESTQIKRLQKELELLKEKNCFDIDNKLINERDEEIKNLKTENMEVLGYIKVLEKEKEEKESLERELKNLKLSIKISNDKENNLNLSTKKEKKSQPLKERSLTNNKNTENELFSIKSAFCSRKNPFYTSYQPLIELYQKNYNENIDQFKKLKNNVQIAAAVHNFTMKQNPEMREFTTPYLLTKVMEKEIDNKDENELFNLNFSNF